MRVVRKRYRVVMLAALVAALVVPVGFALSLESSPGWRSARPTVVATPASTLVASSVVVPTATAPELTQSVAYPIPDAAKLLIVGSALIGLAAAVRKAS
jgi:type II secretory pathway component PulL